MRVVRFLTAESSVFIAQATGNLLSTQLLLQPSWIGSNYEMRNYSATFIIAIASSILALIWALIRIEFKNNATNNYSDDKSDIEVVISNNNEGETAINNNNEGEEDERKAIIEKNDSGNLSRRWKQAKEILNPKFVILSFRTVISQKGSSGSQITNYSFDDCPHPCKFRKIRNDEDPVQLHTKNVSLGLRNVQLRQCGGNDCKTYLCFGGCPIPGEAFPFIGHGDSNCWRNFHDSVHNMHRGNFITGRILSSGCFECFIGCGKYKYPVENVSNH